MQIIGRRPLGHLRHDVVQDLELATSKHQIQGLAYSDHHHQHQREQDGGLGEGLDQPKDNKTGQLNDGEQVDALDGNL